MNTGVSAYTTLESLLLFQCLHAYGVESGVFNKISDLLKKNADITSHKHFQIGRLSAESLRNFYLDRLRREIEYEQADSNGETNGHVLNPKKRKKSAPALPSVQESLQYRHLVPKLVNKLYASFRKEVTDQIRADENKYDSLQRELESIKRGEWDDQLRERADGRSPVSRSPTLPSKSPRLPQKPSPPIASPHLGQNGAQANAPTPDGTPQRRSEPPSPLPQPHPAQPLAPPPPPRFQQPTNQQYNGPPLPHSPYLPGQHPPQNLPPPSPHQHPARTPQPQSPAVGSSGASPHPQPVQPYGSNGLAHYVPPPGAPSPYTPGHQRLPPPPPGPQPPGMQPQHPQQRPQYAPPLQQPYPPHFAQPPPQAGFMLPPFQVAPQEPSRVHPQSAVSPHYPQVSTPVSGRQQPQSGRPNMYTPGSARPSVPPTHPLVTQARQSLSTPVNNRSPLEAMGTPMSGKSLWKKSLGLAETPAPSPRPEVEPVDDFVPSAAPTPNPTPPRVKAQRKSRAKGKGKEKENEHELADAALAPATPSEPQPDDSVAEPETRSGRSRRKAAPKRTRPGSIASSRAGGSVRDRSRSQSILSHTETVAADNDSQAGNRIKSERANSVDAIEEESVDTPSQMTTRRGAASRRKRTAREASLDEDQFSTPGPPRTISAPRYFNKTSNPIMNDIQSHKHASTFSSAVRAKDAEGYYDMIKRPTDLKSIQKAITFGGKQVQAAASDTPIGSPGGGGGVVELPATPDNMPPKAIVNAAQLEKELMRMFVNAVMFNPGEEGVVEDAREMFETVQRSVSSWRNVERSSGRTEVEDTPTAEDEDAPPLGKRRKV